MDAPPPRENVLPFVRVASLLAEMGMSVPQIIASDVAEGLLLLEDLGDMTFTRALQESHDEEALYRLATQATIELHRRLDPERLALLPVHDEERCLREVSLLLEWYWPAIDSACAPPDQAVADSFLAAWQKVLPSRNRVPKSIALFDFHVDNLMILPARSGVMACGLLDFQDAVSAPMGFDLASLLEDVRRTVPQEIKIKMIDCYLSAFPEVRKSDFLTAYYISAAQRNVRIVGTFARLLRRDGKAHYQAFIPRVWELIDEHLRHPELAPVKNWFDRYLPVERRMTLEGMQPHAHA